MSDVITYRASHDPFVIWVSILVSVVVLAVGAGGLRAGMVAGSGTMRGIGYGVGVLCIGFLAVSYLYAPRRFKVSDDAVIVDRPAKDVEIAIASVESVEPIQISLLGATRTFGNGGLFGVYGSFRNKEIGSFKIYGSRLGDAVLLRTAQGPFVLTPDEGGAFMDQVRARMAGEN